MEKGHVKITLEDIGTKQKATLQLNLDTKEANFDLNDMDIDKSSPLFKTVFAESIRMLGLENKFLETMQEIMGEE